MTVTFSLWPWTLILLPLYSPAILHLCMKYDICTLKTAQVILSEPKCLQSSVMILTFDLLTPKCVSALLPQSCIYVWNMKSVLWNLFKMLCQNQSVDKVQWWPWPFDPKMYKYLCLNIWYLNMKYESCTLKTTLVILSETKSWQSSVVILTFGHQNVY